VDIAAFWRTLGHPIVSDVRGEVWVSGTAADSRTAALTGLEAPDFALPHLSGVEHRLSDLRGPKSLPHDLGSPLTRRAAALSMPEGPGCARSGTSRVSGRGSGLGSHWTSRTDQDQAKANLPQTTAEMALADAHFRLGAWLRRNGRADEAAPLLAEASRRHPDSWNIWRQAADLD
jgi:hypothetical protein